MADRRAEEDQSVIDAAWAEEIRRRFVELDTGTAKTMSREEALRFISSDAGNEDTATSSPRTWAEPVDLQCP